MGAAAAVENADALVAGGSDVALEGISDARDLQPSPRVFGCCVFDGGFTTKLDVHFDPRLNVLA
jgi:hypothetical protein